MVGRRRGSQRCPPSHPRKPWIHYLLDKKEFADVIKVKNLEMERVCCIIQVGPIQSHESLKEMTVMREQFKGRRQRDGGVRRIQ